MDVGKSGCEFTFTYTHEDFKFNIISSANNSKFDLLIKEKWTKAEQNKVMRYQIKPECMKWKYLEGKYGLLIQLNTQRFVNRRTPVSIVSMNQPFDKDLFNFTKIADKEILFNIINEDGNDVISVNASPITWGHSLILPDRYHGLPQKMNLRSLKLATELLLLSNSINLRVLFNSLCANASVNHLHWHLYYLDQRMLLETIALKHFIGPVYTIENFPALGYCIQLSSIENKKLQDFVFQTYTLVNCLQENEIAHNVYITRAKTNSEGSEFNDIRAYVWARKKSHGIKNIKFNIAACELFGHFPLSSEEEFISSNENYLSDCLEDITKTEFMSSKEKVEMAFQENMLQSSSSNV